MYKLEAAKYFWGAFWLRFFTQKYYADHLSAAKRLWKLDYAEYTKDRNKPLSEYEKDAF